MTVLDSSTALLVALKFMPEGKHLTVHTRKPAGAKTNIVAELRKERSGLWSDFEVLRRPVTADGELLPETWIEDGQDVISPHDLAAVLGANADLYVDVED